MKCVIDDVGVDTSRIEQFGIEIFNVQHMTAALCRWERWRNFAKETTLIILPGNGAADVQRTIGDKWFTGWRTITIAATRFWWAGCQPVAVVESPQSFDFQTRDVIIVDDVISSGATIQKIRERYAVWMPNARWHAVAWVAQCSAVLRGFSTHYAAVVMGTDKTKVPINSLSTLLNNWEVATSYARRNFSQPEAFLAALNALR